MLDKLTIDDFISLLNQTFQIQLEAEASLPAELIDVSGLGPEPEADGELEGRRAFSVVFRAPMEPILPQRIYSVEHETLGSLDLFLVPLGPGQIGMRYEAVFT